MSSIRPPYNSPYGYDYDKFNDSKGCYNDHSDDYYEEEGVPDDDIDDEDEEY